MELAVVALDYDGTIGRTVYMDLPHRRSFSMS